MDLGFWGQKRVKKGGFLGFFEKTPKKAKKGEKPDFCKKGGIFPVVVPFLGPKVGVPASILGGGWSILRSILRRGENPIFGVFGPFWGGRFLRFFPQK